MLAKKTVKNQITLPKAVVSRFGNVEYFEVSAEGDSIILTKGELSGVSGGTNSMQILRVVRK